MPWACGLTDEMVSQSLDLHAVLQVFVSQDFSAAGVQTTVHHLGNFSPCKRQKTTKSFGCTREAHCVHSQSSSSSNSSGSAEVLLHPPVRLWASGLLQRCSSLYALLITVLMLRSTVCDTHCTSTTPEREGSSSQASSFSLLSIFL